MKTLFAKAVVAISGFMCLVSCAEEVLNETAGPASTGVLRVATRQGESDPTPVSGAYVYLFDNTDACVSILQTETDGSYASAKLPAGTYTLCALGGDGLSHFELPTKGSATPTTVLTLAENQTLGDLLMKKGTVTLDDGESDDISLELERKVLEITSVTIGQVPTGVTGVEVSISSLYGSVQLNGEYIASSSAPCVVTLADKESGTWQATPQMLVFPSKEDPVITITFTAEGADPSYYTYTATEPFEANHKFNLVGTYTEPLGVYLSGTVTAMPWADTPIDVEFEFDEDNASTTSGGNDPTPGVVPIQGDLYNGYYVVSVDASHRTAVLLCKTEKKGIENQATFNSAISSFSKPEGVTNDWRLPTITECNTFLLDANTPDIRYGESYYCKDENEALYRIKVKKQSDNTITTESPFSCNMYVNTVYLRPVIDITY